MKKKKVIRMLVKKVIELDIAVTLISEILDIEGSDKLVKDLFKKVNE